ncbi:MAG: arginine--tRNA ligase [Spirochaetaceae bacterium]|nr:arginine--tRNA ligase [Spirochaetaceae bacterium]
MADLRSSCGIIVADALNILIKNKALQIPAVEASSIVLETPPDASMGDVGIPMFSFAKVLRMGPPVIASEVIKIIESELKAQADQTGTFVQTGPYVNIKLNKASAASSILGKIAEQKDAFGSFDADGNKPLSGRRVMIEFSSPNTNKPLHLGHLRNDALGESVSRILKAAGAEVYKVDLINNRGVHICKSMLAYIVNHSGHPEYVTENGLSPDYVFTLGDTPESLGLKSDRFVGDCYVEFEKLRKAQADALEAAGKPADVTPAEATAQGMLVEWEKGNAEIRKLWQQMNDWATGGIKQTYARTGVSFDKFYFESETYLKGKEIILKGLEDGVFFKAEDGSVRIDVTEASGKSKDGGEQYKVMLRKDGTSVYITQDIGTAVSRHADWDFNQLVYVVGSEQQYHFKVLFYILRKLGYDWTDSLFHLSYGMVNLPEGKMKSREGTVVDADDLINTLHEGALSEITEKGREEAVGDPDDVAEKVALGALHYFLLQTTPTKDMMFNPKESLSFNGNTGPYLQYMGARISSILRKTAESGLSPDYGEDALSLLTDGAEWELVKVLGDYPAIIAKAAKELDPSLVANYLYEVSKAFSKFYHDCPIISVAEQNKKLAGARLAVAECVRTVLKNGLNVILVPFLETM